MSQTRGDRGARQSRAKQVACVWWKDATQCKISDAVVLAHVCGKQLQQYFQACGRGPICVATLSDERPGSDSAARFRGAKRLTVHAADCMAHDQHRLTLPTFPSSLESRREGGYCWLHLLEKHLH